MTVTNNYAAMSFSGFTPGVGGFISLGSLGGGFNGGNLTFNANTLWLMPLWLPVPMTFNKWRLWLQTGVAASFVQCGLFTFDLNAKSAALIADFGSMPTTSSNTFIDLTLTNCPLAGPGWIAAGVNPSAAIAMSILTLTMGLSTDVANQPASSLSVSTPAGPFAASYSGMLLNTASPWVSLQRAT